MEKWFMSKQIQEEIEGFTQIDITGISKLNYFLTYDEFYSVISCLEIAFEIKKDSKEKILNLRFNDISSLKIDSFGGSYNQLVGVTVRKLESTFESSRKCIFEDYEDQSISFYFKDLKIQSIENKTI